jgi:hypothetical protein
MAMNGKRQAIQKLNRAIGLSRRKKVRKTFAQNVSEYAPVISVFTTLVTLGVLIFQVTR